MIIRIPSYNLFCAMEEVIDPGMTSSSVVLVLCAWDDCCSKLETF